MEVEWVGVLWENASSTEAKERHSKLLLETSSIESFVCVPPQMLFRMTYSNIKINLVKKSEIYLENFSF